MVQNLENKLKEKTLAEQNSPVAELCIICEEKELETVLLPCAHLCSCFPCSSRIQSSGACPICRSRISSTLKVFRSGASFK